MGLWDFIGVKAAEKVGAALYNSSLDDVVPCDWHDCRKPVVRGSATLLDLATRRSIQSDGTGAPDGPLALDVKGQLRYYCSYPCRRASGRYIVKPLFGMLIGIAIMFLSCGGGLAAMAAFGSVAEDLGLYGIFFGIGVIVVSTVVFMFRLVRG